MIPLGNQTPADLRGASRAKPLDLVSENVPIVRGCAEDRVEPSLPLLEVGEEMDVKLVDLTATRC
jgi:hypothetical protein